MVHHSWNISTLQDVCLTWEFVLCAKEQLYETIFLKKHLIVMFKKCKSFKSKYEQSAQVMCKNLHYNTNWTISSFKIIK
jgi:hypothetical protein